MIGRMIRTLPEAEVISRWAELYVAGKQAGYAKTTVGLNADHYLGRDDTWVEVEVPHDLYNADWNAVGGANLSSSQVERAERYARQPGPLPPGMAGFKGRHRAKKLYVSDGNHRAYAAFLRGGDTARFYVPQNEWQRFQEAHKE